MASPCIIVRVIKFGEVFAELEMGLNKPILKFSWISSLALDLLQFFTDATLLQGNLIWQEMMECQEGDLKELTSRTWNADKLRAACHG